MVYMIGFDEIPLIKIGTSNNVKKRIEQINTATPFVPRLLATCNGGRDYEKQLHENLAQFHYFKEFYGLPPDVLLIIVESGGWNQTNVVDAWIWKYQNDGFKYSIKPSEK